MTERETKRWLCRGLDIRRRLESLERSKRKAWEAATGTVAAGGSVRSGSEISRRSERYGELSEAVDREMERLRQVEAEITAAISGVEDNTLAALLQDRYVNGLSWAEIAGHLRYSESHVKHTLHPKALRAVKVCTHVHAKM